MKTEKRFLEPTPIQYLGKLPGGQKLFIKRDDLLGFCFGGNKCRIGAAFLEDMEKLGADFMVSYGSRSSNLNRVVAALCRSRNIPCMILSSEEKGEKDGFNAAMICRMGIRRTPCSKDKVADTVRVTLQSLRNKGFHPYYIYGNEYGRGNEAVARTAYQKAYQEILDWQKQNQISFDGIFLASGTGMTQGGLLAGKRENGGREKIIGISVARELDSGVDGVCRYAGGGGEDICFETEYRCGGYGKYDEEIEAGILQMMEDNGIALDPIYTGKAYAGMLRWLKKQGEGMEHVLFLHTGGLPLYFDYLNNKMKEVGQ